MRADAQIHFYRPSDWRPNDEQIMALFTSQDVETAAGKKKEVTWIHVNMRRTYLLTPADMLKLPARPAVNAN